MEIEATLWYNAFEINILSFTVAASGTGLTYRWQYSGSNGSSWGNSVNGTATQPTLHISELNDYQLGLIWRCV